MDPSLKNLIPCAENLFPSKQLLKVWGEGAIVGLFFFFSAGFWGFFGFCLFGLLFFVKIFLVF